MHAIAIDIPIFQWFQPRFFNKVFTGKIQNGWCPSWANWIDVLSVRDGCI